MASHFRRRWTHGGPRHVLHFRPGECCFRRLAGAFIPPRRRRPRQRSHRPIAAERPFGNRQRGPDIPAAAWRPEAARNRDIEARNAVRRIFLYRDRGRFAAPGNWTCDIDNDSLEAITFTTTVTFPIDVPVATASFDIGLLNIILAKLVDAASVRLHIESSGDGSPRSFVSLSQDIADLLGLPSVTTFPVADQTDTVLHFDIIYRIVNLNSDPEYPIFYLQPDPLAIMFVLRFDTQSARLVAQNLPSPADVIVNSLDIEATIGFGSGVQIAVNAVAHVDFQNIDASDKLAGGIRDGINSQLQDNPAVAALLDKKALRSRIDSLFVQMMRLGKGAVIRGYSVNDGALTVTYFVPPP